MKEAKKLKKIKNSKLMIRNSHLNRDHQKFNLLNNILQDKNLLKIMQKIHNYKNKNLLRLSLLKSRNLKLMKRKLSIFMKIG
jgi:hypothetical protein